MHPSTLAKRVQILLSLAFIAFYFYGLGHLPLVGPDEPRYAQVAREMFLRNDWITPTLGGHTWFEKPALLYWLIIPAFKIFGVHEWSARLGPAICGLLTIAGMWSIARVIERSQRVADPDGFSGWSFLIGASCLGTIVFSRAVSFDIVITSTVTWALYFFLRSQLVSEPAKHNRFMLGFYVMVGVSVLAKGLVGIVIPLGVVGFYFLLRREWPSRRLWLSLVWGVPASLVVTALWYGPVINRHGWQFIDEFFIQHHFARYLSNKYHHPQPVYFYPVILLMLAVPWTSYLIDAFVSARKWQWRDESPVSRASVLLLAWILFPILFFSFSSSKLPGYILPVLPPALLLAGASATKAVNQLDPRWPLKGAGIICVVLGVFGAGYGFRAEHLSLLCVLSAGLPLILAGLFALIWKREAWSPLLSIAGSLLVAVVVILNCAAPIVSRRESARDLLALADARGYSSVPILAMHGDDRSAQFYASGRVIYGNTGEVVALDDAASLVDAARNRKEKILAFIPAEDIELFQGRPGIEVIGENGKLALLCLY
ncbi:MAG TPA: glycosyltransferase family 39 protein [Pyrinomonadaceae bacterium]|nr:glycosyltransferase family 39 protein [Pyrinomonadaceae bacterium]